MNLVDLMKYSKMFSSEKLDLKNRNFSHEYPPDRQEQVRIINELTNAF